MTITPVQLKAAFSSKSVIWSTPEKLFKNLDREFQFTTDVCALPENAKCTHFYTPEINGLKQQWKGVCWMNPPYGKTIGIWVRKAHQEAQNGCIVVALLPARTDTRFFHDYIYNKHEIRFLKGRLKFGNAINNAPFPSMIVVFRKNDSDRETFNLFSDR